jgi:hypothetical protein
MQHSERQEMAGRPRTKQRTDTGTKRGSYVVKHDPSGKTFKENAALKGFWTDNKMVDIIQLSSEELDKLIDNWLIEYQTRQMKRNSSWWYPTIFYDPRPKKKKEKKINTSFNSSFVQKKVL